MVGRLRLHLKAAIESAFLVHLGSIAEALKDLTPHGTHRTSERAGHLVEDRAQGDGPEQDRAQGDRAERDRPEGDGPEGDGPEEERPEGEGPEGDGPEGDRPEGDGPEGDRPEGDGPEGDGPEGDRPEGDGPEEERPEGDGPEGDGPEGDRPEEERPQGDRPEGDGPEGDRPEGDRAEGDGPEGDRPEGDRAEGDGPEGDRPEGDRPEGDRPEGHGPEGHRGGERRQRETGTLKMQNVLKVVVGGEYSSEVNERPLFSHCHREMARRIQGGKEFGALKSAQEERLNKINEEFLSDTQYEEVEDLSSKLELFKTKFMEFDLDISGDLDIMGLKQMLEKLGKAKTHLELKKILSQVSAGETISYRDFLHMMLGKNNSILKLILMFEDMGKDKEPAETGPPGRRTFADLP
ncbi:unnamed protein product [Gadus morhua 'NCC']